MNEVNKKTGVTSRTKPFVLWQAFRHHKDSGSRDRSPGSGGHVPCNSAVRQGTPGGLKIYIRDEASASMRGTRNTAHVLRPGTEKSI